MSKMDPSRIMARQVAHERELTVDELKLVAGGGFSTNNGLDCDKGWQPTYDSQCLASDGDPCDMDAEVYD